ncbi:glycoside hydrolase family 18 protein [Patescibacteria group bacterium]|nr:glycoside hydrolase family 18 protein [Patescibacteria group bacterium]
MPIFRKFALFGIFFIYLGILIGVGIFFFQKITNNKSTQSPFLQAVEFFESKSKIVEKTNTSTKISYGFLPYWEDIDVNKSYEYLTHVSYFAIFLSEGGSIDRDYAGYKALVKNDSRFVKILESARTKKLKTNLTIAIHEVEKIDNFLECEKSCFEKSFIQINEIVKKYSFQGLNFDFEYPTLLLNKNDIIYANYVKQASDFFKKKYGENFEISVSVYGDSSIKSRITNLQELNSDKIDYLFVMSYDYVTRTSNIVGPSAPINGYPEYFEYDLTNTIISFLKIVPAEKLILGIPLYGLNFIADSELLYSNRIPGDEIRGFSMAQNLEQVYEVIERENITPQYDENLGSYYFSYKEGVNTRVVFLEGEKSISKKLEIIKNNNFLGVGFWALGYDSKFNYSKLKDFLNNK